MKILFTGGGSGGHIFPIIAIVREIRRFSIKEKMDFVFMGPKDEFGSLLLSQEDIKTKNTAAGKIRRYAKTDKKALFQNIIDLCFKIPFAILQAFFQIFFSGPDLIFSKGGYGSVPTIIAGWILRVPIFIHESDSTPGLSNKLSARLAKKIFVSFPDTLEFDEDKMILVGDPIRRELLRGSPKSAKERFGLKEEKPLILILGGSQGAERINDLILTILPEMVRIFEIIHQCGEKKYKTVKQESRVITKDFLHKYYRPFPFLKEEELRGAYSACDLVISRAGSGTIFETAAFGKPSILIPLPESAQNHQINNAYNYAENGAAIVLEEANFKPRFFLETLKTIISEKEKLEEMGKNAKSFSKPLAARNIATYLLSYLNLIV